LLVLTDDTIEHLPRGRSHLADQLSRASTSIVLNIAEGAGKYSKADKRRYYLTGSATRSPRPRSSASSRCSRSSPRTSGSPRRSRPSEPEG
jgi:hypothetical protein